ncbi:alpha/beta fold hydrolase [Microbacterium sp.]|uniref:alpha/beta fold hydrolase n=1 Tax=Microbacterium sp. TaxID=51671 RepID=UPI0028118AE7|nr:alpha/beta hydrolase [Microbacterium sp.]
MPLFVLVHGIGMSHRYLSRLQDVLATRVRTLAVDLPGFGGLPKPGTDLDVPAMAAAIGRVLDVEGVRDAVLVGQSMGTQWVVELGAQRPELTRAVVVIGPVADARHRTLFGQSRALFVDTLGEPPGANALVFTDYLRCGPRWYLTQLRHMLGYPIERRVADLRMPLVIVRGARDPIAGREWCERLRDAARTGSLTEIPGRVHNAQHSAPAAVAAAILTHVGMPSPTTAGER